MRIIDLMSDVCSAGLSRRAETRATIDELGFADSLHSDPAEAVKGADLVIFCVPVGANAALEAEAGPQIEAGAIVTDVGSVKTAVIRDIGPYLADGVEFKSEEHTSELQSLMRISYAVFCLKKK